MTKSKKRAMKKRVRKRLESSEESYYSESSDSQNYQRKKRNTSKSPNKKSNLVFTSFYLDRNPKYIGPPDSNDFPDYVKDPNLMMNNYQQNQAQYY